MLCFNKRPNSSEIILDLKTKNNRIIKCMDPILVNNFKLPHFGSPEFDLIEPFIKCQNNTSSKCNQIQKINSFENLHCGTSSALRWP